MVWRCSTQSPRRPTCSDEDGHRLPQTHGAAGGLLARSHSRRPGSGLPTSAVISWTWHAFGLTGIRPALSTAQTPVSRRSARARYLPAWPRTVWFRLTLLQQPRWPYTLGVTAHADGWPIAGGERRSPLRTRSLGVLRASQAAPSTLATSSARSPTCHLPTAPCSTSPPASFLSIAGNAIPEDRSRPYRQFHHGPGIFKLDWALSAPIPWSNELCRRAGTVHLGGSVDEIATSEADAWYGRPNSQALCPAVATQPFSTRPARRPVSTPRGRTVTRRVAAQPMLAAAIEDQIELVRTRISQHRACA